MLKFICACLLTIILQSEGNYVLKHGAPLSPKLQTIAQEIGIQNPQDIRILIKGKIFGLSDIIGLTIGRALLIKRGYLSDELLIHELIHVKQYQDAGNIKTFLKKYLTEIFKYGYYDAPLEVEARIKSSIILERINNG
jgi:hypothetical protein